MLTRKELISDSALCIKKSKGCMIGLAVGDALGDLGRDNAMRNRYGIVTDFFTSSSGSTDDTEFALLTAKELIDCDGKLSKEAVFEAWEKYILAEGGLFDRGGRPLYGAAANLSRGMMPPQSGTDNVMNNDDGAAMRISPVGIICAGDPEKAAEMAVLDAQISHAEDGITAAKMVAASVATAMVNGTTEEIIEAGMQQLKPGTWLERAMNTAMTICDEANSIEDAWGDLHTKLWAPIHSVAAEAIPQIFAVYRLVAGDYKKAIFWGTNFGRDADTIGAVLGALCGAKGGIDIIPAEWVERVRYPSGVCLKFAKNEDIVKISEKLADIMRKL